MVEDEFIVSELNRTVAAVNAQADKVVYPITGQFTHSGLGVPKERDVSHDPNINYGKIYETEFWVEEFKCATCAVFALINEIEAKLKTAKIIFWRRPPIVKREPIALMDGLIMGNQWVASMRYAVEPR